MVTADYFTYMGQFAVKAYAFIGIFGIHGSVNHFWKSWVSDQNRFCSPILAF